MTTECKTCEGKGKILVSCCGDHLKEPNPGYCPTCGKILPPPEKCPDCNGTGELMGEVELAEDIQFYNKFRKVYDTYGKKGEKIKIISLHENVFIAENKRRERFSVHESKIKKV